MIDLNTEEEIAYLNYIIPHYGLITTNLFSGELTKRYIKHEPEEKTANAFLDFSVDPKPLATGIEVTRLEPKVTNHGKIEGPSNSQELINRIIHELNQENSAHDESQSHHILLSIDYTHGLPTKKKLKKCIQTHINNILNEPSPITFHEHYLFDASHIWVSATKIIKSISPKYKERTFISLEYKSYDYRFSEGWNFDGFNDLREIYTSDPFDDLIISKVSGRIDYPIQDKTKKYHERIKEFSFLKEQYRRFELVLVTHEIDWRNAGQYVQKSLMRLKKCDESIWNDIIVVDSMSPSYFSLKNQDKFHFPNFRPHSHKWWSIKQPLTI